MAWNAIFQFSAGSAAMEGVRLLLATDALVRYAHGLVADDVPAT
jgi:hypothetical protein